VRQYVANMFVIAIRMSSELTAKGIRNAEDTHNNWITAAVVVVAKREADTDDDDEYIT
jgi:hypothetical protein